MTKANLGVRVALVVALIFALASPAVFAQGVSGAVEGTVNGPDGAALPGVLVTLTGDGFPSGSAVQTNERGRYRYPAVPPGNYVLRATLDGFSDAEVPRFRVNIDSQLSVDMAMQLEAVEEVIIVTGDVPLFSITASDTSATISDEWIDKMPVSRDFTGVIEQAAGANGEDDLLGGISIDGSSGSENRFVIDGIDTTNLQTGISAKTLITDFVEEVQVKQGGYEAEFGGSTGGVINAVTKQGGSDFTGDVHVYLEDSSWDGSERPELRPGGTYETYKKDDRTRTEPGFTLGGPLHKDHMWFFVGYSPAEIDIKRFPDGSPDTYQQTTDREYATANVTGSYGKFYFRLGGNLDDAERDNLLPAQNGDNASGLSAFDVDSDQPSESYSGSVDYLATPNWSASLRGGHFEYDTQDGGFNTGLWAAASTGSIGGACQQFPTACDPSQDIARGQTIPGFSDNRGTLFDLFERDYVQLDSTVFVEDLAGDHEIKVGVQQEDIGNSVLRGYSNTRILFYIDRSVTDLFGVSQRGPFGYYRVLQIATQGDVTSENTGLFAQDSWRVNDRLTLNLGIRAEEENVPSYASSSAIPDTAIAFDYDDKLAPRLGFAYDVTGDGTWKAYGSYGVFYDITKLEMPRGSFGGDKWVDFFYAMETLDFNGILTSGCRITNNDIGSVPNCPGTFLFAADRRHPSNDPADPTIDPNMKPMESNEITLGVEHLLGRNMTVGARYVHKELERTIEDVGIVVPGVGEVFYIANPGEGIATNILGPEFPNQPKPVRDYDALTLTFRKNFTDNWGLNMTYTYSELYGNYSGLSSSDEDGRVSPNVNRFFDSLNGSFDQNGRAVYGKLGTDRPHQFKAQFIYGLPFGTFVGVNQRYASGTPLSSEYSVSPGLPFFPFGRGDRGRTPTFTQTDLYVGHEFTFGGRYGIEVSANITNLFDQDTVIDEWKEANLQDLPLSEAEFFAGFDTNQVVAANGIPLDARFGQAEQYQAPRSVRLGVKFKF